VEPTFVSLRRAGISDPKLVIGNQSHPSVSAPGVALSDAEVKVLHQRRIRDEYGSPVAIIDDRVANRAAIMKLIGPAMLGVAICIPGFTYDPASENDPLRLSTFQVFDHIV
jgi:hypothetical protein